MNVKKTVLIAGRSKEGIDDIAHCLANRNDIRLKVRHIQNGHTDPLYGISDIPSILILDLSSGWEAELESLNNMVNRPLLIAVGPVGNPEIMRMAMRAGARDFMTHQINNQEINATISKMLDELAHSSIDKERGALTAVINAKGGSGASFIASNIAHCMKVYHNKSVAAIDMDLQFGTLSLFFDVTPRENLIDAINIADQLDTVALNGYMSKHNSGLHLLSAFPDPIALPWELSDRNLGRLLDLAVSSYERVVVDLPRQIDPVTSKTIESADKILIVMQQGVAQIHDTRRLLGILTNELSISRDNIFVIVNRYDNKAAVTFDDIEDALKISNIIKVPNDYKRVSECINLGIPLLDDSMRSSISKSLISLVDDLYIKDKPVKKRLFRNPFASFMSN